MGRNFSTTTECMIDSILTPTRWLASNMLECEIPFNGYAGQYMHLKLRERGRFYSKSEDLAIKIITQPYVYRVEPSKVLSGRIATMVKVYIADMNAIPQSQNQVNGYYCKFGSKAVKAQAVLDIHDIEEDRRISQSQVKLSPITRREIHCRSPLLYTSQIVQVEIKSPSGSTFSVGSVNSTFEYIARPQFQSLSRYVAPVSPSHDPFSITFIGSQFSESLSYKCIYDLLSFKNQTFETSAWRNGEDSISCNLPNISNFILQKLVNDGSIFTDISVEAEWATSGLGLPIASERIALETSGRILLYLAPTISKIWPNWGTSAGGTEVYIEGIGLDLGLAEQILCKFGQSIVIARVITPSTLVMCLSPENPEGLSLVTITVDNVEYFGAAQQENVYFSYVSEAVFSATTESIESSPVGVDNIVTITVRASGFLDTPTLTDGYPLCRFTFLAPALSRVTSGRILNSTHISCPSPHAAPKFIADCDDSSEDKCLYENQEAFTSISYNGVEFWPDVNSDSLTSLMLEQRPAISAIVPPFGFADTSISLTIYGSRLDGASQVLYGDTIHGYKEAVIPLSNSAIDSKLIIPRFEFDNVTQTGDNTLFGETVTQVELYREIETNYSTDGLAHQYVARPVLSKASTDVISANGGARVVLVGQGFRNTTELSCKFGAFWSTDAIFYNETVIECISPPLALSAGEKIQISVSFNGEELASSSDSDIGILELLVGEVPTAIRIEPQVVFWGEEQILIQIRCEGLLDVPSLSCRAGNVIMKGTYGEDEDGTQYANCTIPSHEFLAASSSNDQWESLPSGVFIEASNDGVLFSDDECLLRLVPKEQTGPIKVEPSNGPEIGGTMLNITYEDFPVVSHTPITCTFPGQDPVIAEQIDDTLVRCVTPALVPSAEGIIKDTIFSRALVQMHVGERELPSFYFSYSTRLYVSYIDPENTVHPPTYLEDSDPSGIAVVIYGESFLPSHIDGLRCRMQIDDTTFVEVVATALSNKTMTCDIPGSATQSRSAKRQENETEITLPLEISLNGGQHYTDSGYGLILRQPDLLQEELDEDGKIIPSVNPSFAYVNGGTLLTVSYERAYDPYSPRARCFFHRIDPADGRERYLAIPIFSLNTDQKFVQCFAPPAHLLTDELFENGGTVFVYLSSNGRDLSANTCSFRYRTIPLIEKVIPLRLLVDVPRTIYVWGYNFFDPYVANDLEMYENPESGPLIRLTALEDETRQRQRQVTYVNSSLISFEWPTEVFESGEQIRLELTLDGDLFTKSPAPLTVYGGVILGRVRPQVIHQSIENDVQDLYAETITNLLDTDSLDLLRCRFQKQAAFPLDSDNPQSILRECDECNPQDCSCTTAKFINRTLLHCPVPKFVSLGAVIVDVSVDTTATYSTPQDGLGSPLKIWIVDSIESFHAQLALNSSRVEKEYHGINATVGTGNLAYWETVNDRSYLNIESLSNTWNGVGVIHVRVGGVTRAIEALEGQPAVLELPRGLIEDDYPVEVSIDGGGTFVTTGLEANYTLEIRGCPAGSFCDSIYEQKCLEGSYCPQSGSLSPIKCAIGMVGRHLVDDNIIFQKNFEDYVDLVENLSQCDACPSGGHCPIQGLPFNTYRACPPGYVCGSHGSSSLSQLEPCPAGHYCPLEGGPIYCPEGFWCPEATSTIVWHASNYSTPQPCRDGVRCGSVPGDAVYFKAHPDAWEEPSGAKDAGGVAECPIGSFCQNGLVTPCPAGSFCRSSGLPRATECPPGSFRAAEGSSECRLCPPGTFCYYSGQAIPYQCKPGFTCQYEGGSMPIQPCPAGSYCSIAIAATMSNSTMQLAYHPRLCSAKTYCLWGVYDRVVDPTNPQAAQICIAGTFCGEGSETPTGKGLCRAGYYCPPNSSEMIDAPPGTHTPDAGYDAYKECAAGTYQNKPRSSKCKECSKGHSCPDTGMIKPGRCGKGTYSKNLGEQKCTDCPQGTYSDDLGLTAEESCKPCEASFLCEKSGLKKMREAVPCEEGYLCGARTTRTVMLANPCPAGYYSAPGASALEDSYLCPASRYCARGTSASKVGQSECLPSFFCPFGTAASLRPDGTFGDDIRMVPRSILVELIEALIVKNDKLAIDFGIDDREAELEQMREDKLKEIEKNAQLRAENEAAADKLEFERKEIENRYQKSQEALERYEAGIIAAEWAIEAWENRTIHTDARREYLRVNLTLGACDEDAGLPAELVSKYFQDGAMLKCPSGTSSERGSWCLGQCTKPRSSIQPISILDPIDKRDLGVEGGRESLTKSADEDEDQVEAERRLKEEEEEDEWAPRWDGLPAYTLRPLETAQITLDLRDVPFGFEYNEHYAVIILGRANSTESITEEVREQEDWQKEHELGQKQQPLPFYFAAVNDEVTSETGGTVKRAVLELKLFNHQDFESEFRVGIYLFHGLFRPYLDYLANKVTVEFYRANRQAMGTDQTWAILISEMQMAGVTIPYNCPDIGNEPLFYMDMTSTAEGVNHGARNLDKDVYDSTYWQSKQVNAVIMPWIPFFTNCEGYDEHMILYDVFERGGRCSLPAYEDIRIVNPIPSDGLDPIADNCQPNDQYPELVCRFDEPLMAPVPDSSRWYELKEERDLFFITREPIAIDMFKMESEESESPQTYYVQPIEDGSDSLVAASFHPELGQPDTDENGNPIVPTVVEVSFYYYQKSRDVKLMSKVEVHLKEYKPFIPGPGSDPVYRLRLTYEALSYFDLINTFQFSLPIYFLLFTFISIILILIMIVFWLVNLQFSTFKKPPALRFMHLARVTFVPPATGSLLASVPALVVAGLLQMLQIADLSAEINARWTDFGSEVTNAARIEQVRGRLGLAFAIISVIFLKHGGECIISQPTDEEEKSILERRIEKKERERLEQSLDDSEPEEGLKEIVDEKEEDINIVRAVDWKRRHYFVTCMLTALALMVRLEFSYSELFGKNIMEFLVFFVIFDLVLEQLLTRVFMSEALLVSPILGSVVTTEFIMTMGAENYQSFITAYFVQAFIIVASRSYAGPWVERLEVRAQRLVIQLSQKYTFVEKIFKSFLVRQLNAQLQLINLGEYQAAGSSEEQEAAAEELAKENSPADEVRKEVLEKVEGLEALLGSVASYAAQTQALFITPVALVFIILFANETKIPQGYQIRQADLLYYLLFAIIVILPRMIIDAFLLHVLETVHGYKIYDYFTYCDYRFRIRKKKYVSKGALDRSVAHAWRSIDNMCFSSQYYYIISLTTWGILFLYFGLTAMIRNLYNPFADPVLIAYVGAISGMVGPIKALLGKLAKLIQLWEVEIDENIKVDVGAINRLDHANNVKKLVVSIQTNPFRHKFMRVNREWLIHNIALILGGKNYLGKAGHELQYLQAIYQRAVNAEAIDVRLRQEQAKIAQDLALMPYNARAQAKEKAQFLDGKPLEHIISDDSVSDIPAPQWRIPPSLTEEHVQKLGYMWLSFARQIMRLKAMISDLVARQLKAHCQRCRSVYRLQVIQKIGFTQLCDKFRAEHQGDSFTVERWRRFFERRQVFITLCMECAYIDNLNAAHIVEQDGDLQRLMAENALKNVGAHDQYVAQKLGLPHVRRVILKWLWLARSSLLHRVDKQQIEARKKFALLQRRLREDEALKFGQQYSEPEKSQSSERAPSNAPPPEESVTDSLTLSSVGLV